MGEGKSNGTSDTHAVEVEMLKIAFIHCNVLSLREASVNRRSQQDRN